MGSLDGKVAVVTGGAHGIGAAAVRALVREGARVHIIDLRETADTNQNDIAYLIIPANTLYIIQKSIHTPQTCNSINIAEKSMILDRTAEILRFTLLVLQYSSFAGTRNVIAIACSCTILKHMSFT